jgi:hypothetical protein
MTLIKYILLLLVAQLCIVSQCSCQANSADSLTENNIISKIFATCPSCSLVDSTFPVNGYGHFKGVMGNSAATLDLNFDGAYVFSDSLNSIQGFDVTYKKGVLGLSYNDWSFTGGIKTVIQIFLVKQTGNSLYGYAVDDSNKKVVPCRFTENYEDGALKFTFSSFAFHSKFKKFPVQAFGNLLFADSANNDAKNINKLLLDSYDIIGLNYEDDVKELKFDDIAFLKTPKLYGKYAVAKFKRAYQKIITTKFLRDAKESGHRDVFLNGAEGHVICNDGHALVIEIIASFADGDAYPYYETYLFDYDISGKKKVDEMEDGNTDDDDPIFEKKKNELIKRLQDSKLFDDSETGDNWFLSNPKVAFVTGNGIVLVKKGGNHGIHSFYKYYPRNVVRDFLDK